MKHSQTWPAAARLISTASLLAALSSCHDEPPIPEISYLCGNQPLPEDAPGAPAAAPTIRTCRTSRLAKA